ncbi:DUF1311 domain-containing protein [Paracrocinitomix mangrovi]|uniref:lysozyme inhibitor LprI family protein n=1 Tax=Paracrocinitomix mangrovi TaxID=2862509 RepID=UPI001EDA30BF|nr:lysozyme inhibitor LprI family protein [Paracrocinitomix mangrovi]UKN00340.1 DUF1311 domain-containing protein [Paracrocinitomix mangrovi]
MIRFNLLIGLFILSYQALSQDTSDVYRLKNLEYMKLANRVNCDSTTGSNIEHRICLNLEFQEKDAVLNEVYTNFINTCESEEQKTIYQSYHDNWIIYRRKASEIESEGLESNMLGIYYLSTMIKLTELRTEELIFLQEY